MEYTKLGSTGVDVSKVCFGTWRFAKESDGTVETDEENVGAAEASLSTDQYDRIDEAY